MSNLLSGVISFGLLLQAQPVSAGFDRILNNLAAAVIFTILGLIVFAASFFIIVRVVPFSVKKEIEDDQNTALEILIGSMIIGMAIIIAAAISGN